MASKYDRIRKYVKDPITGCWHWHGAEKIWFHGKCCYPDRVLWELVTKEGIEPGMMLHRICYSPDCVNPAHRQKVPKDMPLQPYRWGNRGNQR